MPARVSTRSRAHDTASLYAALSLLTAANAADLFFSAALVHEHGTGAEIMPTMHLVLVIGGLTAFVAVKLLAAVAEVVVALGVFQYLRPDALERRIVLAASWVAAWYTLALAAWAAVQVVLLARGGLR